MKPPLLIFDVDNTLIDIQNDAEYFDTLLVDSLKELGFCVPDRSQRNQLWASGREYPSILAEWDVHDRQQLWSVFDRLDCQRREQLAQQGLLPLVKDAKKILEQFKARGYFLAALSNSNSKITNFLLDFHSIIPYFDLVQGLGPDKDPDTVKPEIKSLLALIEKCDYIKNKNNVFLVGDSWTDIIAAKRAGIHAILYDPHKTKSKYNATPEELQKFNLIVISELKELLLSKIFGNPFGDWDMDENGFPVFVYRADPFRSDACQTFTTYGHIVDQVHLFGNTKWAGVAHNNGSVDLLDCSPGFMWLTHDPFLHLPPDKQGLKKPPQYGGGITELKTVNTTYYDILSPVYPAEMRDRISFHQFFGCNYYAKTCKLGPFRLNRKFQFPSGDKEYCISTIIIENTSETRQKVALKDYWNVNLFYLVRSLVVNFKGRKKYGETRFLNWGGNALRAIQSWLGVDTESARTRFAKKIRYLPFNDEYVFNALNGDPSARYSYIGYHLEYKKKRKVTKFRRPNSTPETFKSIFLVPLIKSKSIFDTRLVPGLHPLSWETEIELSPNEQEKFVSVIGLCEREKIATVIHQIITKYASNSSFSEMNSNSRDKNILIEIEGYPWISREITWHSSYLGSGIYLDDFTNYHKLPQLSIYAFGHGFDGSIRDYALYLPALLHYNPIIAREHLLYILSLMRSNGALIYGVSGFHQALEMIHSKASDLYLFLLWAIVEYINTTRDYTILDENIPFYPEKNDHTPTSATVLDRVRLAIEFLFSDAVGVGEHGLIKVNDGDWSDGISFMVKNRKKFVEKGESAFNTCMALYVLPRLCPLLQTHMPEMVPQIQSRILLLEKAMDQAWNGRWFYRGYDGSGNPIGNQEIFLEHHVWYLLSESIDPTKRAILIHNILEFLSYPSPIGQLIMYPPSKSVLSLFNKGWDVNGGIWHAINALATWTLSNVEGRLGLESLIKNSMHRREEEYPFIWYGIWTGPDSYNAHYAERPGEAFYHLPTPMCDFPAFNMNLHACFIMGAIKALGLDFFHNGIKWNIDIMKNYSIKTALIQIKHVENSFDFVYWPIKPLTGVFSIVISSKSSFKIWNHAFSGFDLVEKKCEMNTYLYILQPVINNEIKKAIEYDIRFQIEQ